MTTTALTETQGQEAALHDQAFADQQVAWLNNDGSVVGQEDLAGDHFGIDRLTLVQTQKQANELGTIVGKYYLGATQETTDKVTAIVLGVVKSRAWLPEYDQKQSDVEPLCRSTDNVHPDPKFVKSGAAPSALCATCPRAQWVNGAPPECSETSNLLGLVDGGIPFLFGARKTAAPAFKQYAKTFVWSKKPFFSCMTEIGAKAQENYFVPTLRPMRDQPIDESRWAELAQMFQEFKAYLRTIRDEDDQAAATPPPAQPAAQPAAPPAQAAPPPPAQPAAAVAPPPVVTPPPAAQPVVAPPPAQPAAPPPAPAATTDVVGTDDPF
jgi:hypothetical protein